MPKAIKLLEENHLRDLSGGLVAAFSDRTANTGSLPGPKDKERSKRSASSPMPSALRPRPWLRSTTEPGLRQQGPQPFRHYAALWLNSADIRPSTREGMNPS